VNGRKEEVLEKLSFVFRYVVLFLSSYGLNLLRSGELSLNREVINVIFENLTDNSRLGLEFSAFLLFSLGISDLRRRTRFSVII
jgi:hypothetical protein